ncbi:MAG: hypothetical protein EBR30_02305 [Cytophagia bacterium]|nr:hypothetical protein [Cytophagia bacterium]
MPTTLIRKGQLKPLNIVDADVASSAAIATSKLADNGNFILRNGTVAMAAALQMGNNKITGLGTPTAATDAATKGYVDGLSQGLDVKASVRAASTANVSATYNATGGTSSRGQFTAAPNTLDGVTLAANDRILLKDQTTGAQNGIYVVTTLGTGANGVWDRATDFDSDAEVTAGAFTFVEEGTTNADSGWVLTTNNPVTIGGASGTALTFAQFSGAGQITAGNGLTKTGNTIDVVGTAGRIVVAADSIDLATVTANNSSGTAGINFIQAVTVDSYGRVTGLQNADVRGASTSQAGIVQLSDAVNSTSTSLAATANAVKQANDNANSRLSNSTSSTQSGYFGDIFLYDDSTPSHYLGITNSANLTAARTLSINVNDGDRTISLSGNLAVNTGGATVGGVNTGDQTITLTGDVTGTGTGTFATTIANNAVTTAKILDANVTTGKLADNAVTDSKFRQSTALSVVGNASNSTANVADIAAGSDHQVLRRSGTSIAFGAVNLAHANAVTGVLGTANGGTGASTPGGIITNLGFKFKEAPTVVTAGTVYTVSEPILLSSEHVFVNGVLMNDGATDDYQVGTGVNQNRITFNYSLDTNDVILVTYIKDFAVV